MPIVIIKLYNDAYRHYQAIMMPIVIIKLYNVAYRHYQAI